MTDMKEENQKMEQNRKNNKNSLAPTFTQLSHSMRGSPTPYSQGNEWQRDDANV
tara:strand:- start:1171 stop:1332 length:162 start_codon:yes stop_codon:yes gene_type:complete